MKEIHWRLTVARLRTWLRKRLGLPVRIYDIRGRLYPLEDMQKCVGKGWAPLVEMVYNALLDGATVSQVKEKYGMLCIYDYSLTRHPEVDEAERLSTETCERCGAPGRECQPNGYWWVTLCEACEADSCV